MDRAAATNESHNTRCGSMSDIRHHVKTGHSKSRAEDLAFEILEIADDSSRDYVKKTGVDGKVTWVFDKEHFAWRGFASHSEVAAARQTSGHRVQRALHRGWRNRLPAGLRARLRGHRVEAARKIGRAHV